MERAIMTDEYTKAAAEYRKDNDKTAGMAGAGAGVLAGAQVGTVLLPIPVVGTFTGALVGGLIGTKIGKKVGGVLLDKMGPAEQAFTSQAPGGARVDVTKELARLAELRAAGVLDEDEFKAAKAKLLGL
jgi:phage tail tape-measure protein